MLGSSRTQGWDSPERPGRTASGTHALFQVVRVQQPKQEDGQDPEMTGEFLVIAYPIAAVTMGRSQVFAEADACDMRVMTAWMNERCCLRSSADTSARWWGRWLRSSARV